MASDTTGRTSNSNLDIEQQLFNTTGKDQDVCVGTLLQTTTIRWHNPQKSIFGPRRPELSRPTSSSHVSTTGKLGKSTWKA
jgi:hypothetical protein